MREDIISVQMCRMNYLISQSDHQDLPTASKLTHGDTEDSLSFHLFFTFEAYFLLCGPCGSMREGVRVVHACM